MSKSKAPATIPVGRSAITGKFVPVNYARNHPNTTIVQRIPNPHK